MKFTREKLIKIIKEEAEMAQKEAENAENDPNSAGKQLEWMDKSMETIRDAIEEEAKLTPEMLEILNRAAIMMDNIADELAFGKLVRQHVDGNPEDANLSED
tara:strand:+ start:297 stop:602 length:306 start_codon:yes stop_codon:yes gene_type:complete